MDATTEESPAAPGWGAVVGLIAAQLAAEAVANVVMREVFHSDNRGPGAAAVLIVPLIFAQRAEARALGCITSRFMLRVAAIVVAVRVMIGVGTVAVLVPETAGGGGGDDFLAWGLGATVMLSFLAGVATYVGLRLGSKRR